MINISLKESLQICDSAIDRARQLGITIAVSVVDSGTNLVAMQKMDGALI